MPTVLLESGTAVVIDDLVTFACDALADGQVTFGEVVQLGGLLGSKVSQFSSLSDAEKQKVVVAVFEVAVDQCLKTLVKKLPESERDAFSEKLKAASAFAQETLPSVLELAASAASGKLDFGKAKKTAAKVVSLGCLCLGRKPPAGLESLVEEPSKKPSPPETKSLPEDRETNVRPPEETVTPSGAPKEEASLPNTVPA
jgi:hypothetical protein